MEEKSVFEIDLYKMEDNGTDIFLNTEIWKKYYHTDAQIHTKYIEVDEGVELLLMTVNPKEKKTERSILVLPGWFSHISSWLGVLHCISEKTTVYYLESREKTSARLNDKKKDFSIEKLADDFAVAIEMLPDPIENIVVLSSSLGGTMLFSYLARYERKPYQTVMVGPNPKIKLPPILGSIFVNLPLFMFHLTIRYISWHIIKFKINKEKEPQQVHKYLQVVRLAVPWKIKASAKKVLKYNGWDDIAKLDRIILVGARMDKMHSTDSTKKIRDEINNSGYIEFETNYDVHSDTMGNILLELAEGDDSKIDWS